MENTLEPLRDDEEIPFITPWKKSDVIFIVDGKELHVHRWILVMQSAVLEAMLGGHFKESSQDKIELKGKCYENMLAFLKLLYPPGMLEVESKDDDINILKMLAIADEYQTTTLMKHLLRQVVITPSNTLNILPYAMTYDSNVCGEKCVKMAQTSVTTKEIKDHITNMSSDVAQKILLKKCEILEDISLRGKSCITAMMNTTAWEGKKSGKTNGEKGCALGHTVEVTKFHEARKCPACLKYYNERFCKSFTYQYLETIKKGFYVRRPDAIGASKQSQVKQSVQQVPLLKLLETMDDVLK